MQYILPETALTGFAQCGVMLNGISGLYTIPDDTIGPPDLSNLKESIPFYIYIGYSDKTEYIAKSSIKWSYSIGGESVSTCSFKTYDFRPNIHDQITIRIGISRTKLWAGSVLRINTGYVGGNKDNNNFTIEYNIDCVGLDHRLTRKYASESYINISAGSIVKDLLKEYMPRQSYGTIYSGKYYDEKVIFSHEQLSSILSRLANTSDAYYYVDPNGIFNFKRKYSTGAPFSLSYESTNTWDTESGKFPKNNYHATNTTEEGGQLVTQVVVHGLGFKKKRVEYITKTEYEDIKSNTSSILPIGSDYNRFLMSDEQKSFFTMDKIYEVNKIKLYYTKFLPNIAEPWEDNIEDRNSYTWYCPSGYYSSAPISHGSKYSGWNSQYSKILGIRNITTVSDNDDGGSDVGTVTLKEKSLPSWENILGSGDDASDWTHTSSPGICAWECRPEDSGNDKYSEYIEKASKAGHDIAFVWNVGHDSNTVSFEAPVTIGSGEYEIRIDRVEIEYYTSFPQDYTYTRNKITHDGSDGIFEKHVEDAGITNSSIASKYADAIFKMYNQPNYSVSYSHYMKNIDILSNRVYPGMVQSVVLHKKYFTLGVESVTYSVISLYPVVIKMDVQLSTMERNLEVILARLLKY